MPEIIVDLSGYTYEFTVFKADGAGTQPVGTCSLDTVASLVPHLCFSNNIEHVHLFGPDELAKGVKNEILANVEFGTKLNLKVEVN